MYQDKDSEIPKLIQLGEGFYVRQEIDNIAWMDMGDHALVIDALEQPQTQEEVFAAIERTVPGRSVRCVLNTHTHYDHVALNGAFERRWSSRIVNMQTTKIGPEGLWFKGSRRSAWMLPMTGCHTEEDCIVWVEPDRVLFVGDIFGWGLIPLTVNLRKETAAVLERTYRRMIEFDPAVVVPGHGPLATAEHLRRWLEYFAWLKMEVSSRVAAGQSESAILSELSPPADMLDWWRMVKWKHADSVGKMLKAVRKNWL